MASKLKWQNFETAQDVGYNLLILQISVSSSVAIAAGSFLPFHKRTLGSRSKKQVTVPGILSQLPMHVAPLPEVLKVTMLTGTIQMVKGHPWGPKDSVEQK